MGRKKQYFPGNLRVFFHKHQSAMQKYEINRQITLKIIVTREVLG